MTCCIYLFFFVCLIAVIPEARNAHKTLITNSKPLRRDVIWSSDCLLSEVTRPVAALPPSAPRITIFRLGGILTALPLIRPPSGTQREQPWPCKGLCCPPQAIIGGQKIRWAVHKTHPSISPRLGLHAQSLRHGETSQFPLFCSVMIYKESR